VSQSVWGKRSVGVYGPGLRATCALKSTLRSTLLVPGCVPRYQPHLFTQPQPHTTYKHAPAPCKLLFVSLFTLPVLPLSEPLASSIFSLHPSLLSPCLRLRTLPRRYIPHPNAMQLFELPTTDARTINPSVPRLPWPPALTACRTRRGFVCVSSFS
jgi:hypothetical protein